MQIGKFARAFCNLRSNQSVTARICRNVEIYKQCERKISDNGKPTLSTTKEHDFRYTMARPAHARRINDFLTEQFLMHNPITASLDSNREKLHDLFRTGTQNCLKYDASYICMDSKNDLVGCVMSLVQDIGKIDISPPDHNAIPWSDDVLKIQDLLGVLSADLQRHMPGCKYALEMPFVAVEPAQKGFGIAGRLVELCMEAGKKLGCEYAYAEAMAYESQGTLEKMGFKTAKVVDYVNYLDKNGQQIFKCKDGRTTCGKLMVKKL